MKRRGDKISVLAVLCTILFFPPAVSAQEIPGAAQPAEYPEGLVHTVVKGDTLWDLSGKYLGSPWLWPGLWERNRFITNPHYIYPGISVVVVPPPPREYGWKVGGPDVPEGGPGVSGPGGTSSPAPSSPGEATPARATLSISPEDFVRAGEFTRDRPTGIGSIIGGEQDKVAFSEGDKVYLALDKEIPEDQILGVYRVRGPVRSHSDRPVSGYVRFLVGVLQVTGMQDGQRTAVVRKSFEELGREDQIHEEIPSYLPVYPQEGAEGLEAYVIAGRSRRVEMATGDFVYLDRGAEAGVAVGERFRLYHSRGDAAWDGGGAMADVRIPVGKAVIVKVLPGSATAYVTDSSQSFPSGTIASRGASESR